MTSSFRSLLLKAELAGPDAFWPAVAQQIIEIAQEHGAPTQLNGIQVVLAQGSHAVALRAALWGRLQQSFMPPRLLLWGELGRNQNGHLARRAQLFDVLRANPWIRSHFGAQPAALWALAQQVEMLGDELTYAAVGRDSALKREDIEAALQRHYRQRAARALLPQARLVLDLWKAGGDTSASERLAALNRCADRATRPLVFVAAERIEPWVRAWLTRYSAQAPVLLIEPDVAAVVRAAPALSAAWPELTEEAVSDPLAVRADALHAQEHGLAAPLKILRTYSLEEEAEAVARHVIEALQQGAASIALVPLDRLTARRVRALLERAHVQVRDETGWKLSTTSAAAALMRWFDVVTDDFYWRDLLDWLKSTFTLADRPHKAQEIAVFEQAMRAGGALQGASAMRTALHAMKVDVQDDVARPGDLEGALEILTLLHTQAQRSARAGPSVVAHLRALQAALDALGMRAALAADVVGRAVLREIETLQRELDANSTRASLADFRALLATRFEESTFIDTEVQSPVVMVSLAATALRAFDHAVLIGADASHLPSLGEPTLFMSNAVRGELGLATRESALHEQAQQLALLLHNVPHVTATWRVHRNGEPNALSPWLERLRFVTQRAWGQDWCVDAVRPAFAVNARMQARPAPSAGALLPRHVSASQAQSLTQCPYQFYARTLLGLRELEDLIEMPDKRDFGDALHEVLRRFHSAWGAAPFHEQAAEEIAASLREHARSVFEPQLARTPALFSFARRFDGLVPGYVTWLQQQCREGWRWQAGELKQNRVLPLRHGVQVELRGRVDRVDQHHDGRVQVIDYKARAAATLKQGLQLAGEDIQLPFYGALLEQTAQEAEYLSFDRAKEGEPGVHSVKPPQSFEALTAAVLNRLHQDLQRVADDAPLPAIGPDAVCAHCEMRGLCRKDYWEIELLPHPQSLSQREREVKN